MTTDGVVLVGADGRPQPDIAESWTMAPDGLSWTLKLRPNVYFHDGSRCDAAAVRRSLEAALKRPNLGQLYPGLLDVTGLETVGDDTLVVHLRRPSAFLLDNLNIQITKTTDGKTTVGTGPYFLVQRTSGEVTLKAHQKYFLGAPQIEQVVFRSYPTLRQAWAGLLRGEIDAVSNLSGDAQDFLTADTVTTFRFQRHYAYVMAFNSKRPRLKDPRVRRALNMAIDRTAIVESVLRGRGRPAHSPIWPDHWAYDRTVTPYSHDPAFAKSELSSRRASAGERISFTCLIPQGYALFERLALVLQRQLFNVGVDLRFEAVALADYDTRLRSGDYDAALLDLLSGPSLSLTYQFWRSARDERGLNVFGYSNASADKWLDRLQLESDDTSVRAATSQLQRIFMDDPPAIYIAWSERTGAVSKRLQVPVAKGLDPLYALSEWRLTGSDAAH